MDPLNDKPSPPVDQVTSSDNTNNGGVFTRLANGVRWAFGYQVGPKEDVDKSIPEPTEFERSQEKPGTLREVAAQAPRGLISRGRHIVNQGAELVKQAAGGVANMGGAVATKLTDPAAYIEGGKKVFDQAVRGAVYLGGNYASDKLLAGFGIQVPDDDKVIVRKALKELMTDIAKFNQGRGEVRDIHIPSLEYIYSTPPIIIKDIHLKINKSDVKSENELSRSFDIENLSCDIFVPSEGDKKSKISISLEDASVQIESDVFKPLLGKVADFGRSWGNFKTAGHLKSKRLGIKYSSDVGGGNEANTNVSFDDFNIDFTAPFAYKDKKVSNPFSFSNFNYENKSANPGLIDITKLSVVGLNDESGTGSSIKGEVIVRPGNEKSLKWLPSSLLDWKATIKLDLPIPVRVEHLARNIKIKPPVINFFKKLLLKRAKVIKLADGVCALKLPFLSPIPIQGLAESKDGIGKGVINIHEAISQSIPSHLNMVAVSKSLTDFLSDQSLDVDNLLEKAESYLQEGKKHEARKCVECLTYKHIDDLDYDKTAKNKDLLVWASRHLLQLDRNKSMALFKKVHSPNEEIPYPFVEQQIERLIARKDATPDYAKHAKEYLEPLLFICKAFPGPPVDKSKPSPLLKLVSLAELSLLPTEIITPFLSELMDENSYHNHPEVLARAVISCSSLLDEDKMALVLGHLPSESITKLANQAQTDKDTAKLFSEFSELLLQNGQAGKLVSVLRSKPDQLWELVYTNILHGREKALAAYILSIFDDGSSNQLSRETSSKAFGLLTEILFNPSSLRQRAGEDTQKVDKSLSKLKKPASELLIKMFQYHFNGHMNLSEDVLINNNCKHLVPLLSLTDGARENWEELNDKLNKMISDIKDDTGLSASEKRKLLSFVKKVLSREQVFNQLAVIKEYATKVNDIYSIQEEGKKQEAFAAVLRGIQEDKRLSPRFRLIALQSITIMQRDLFHHHVSDEQDIAIAQSDLIHMENQELEDSLVENVTKVVDGLSNDEAGQLHQSDDLRETAL